MIPRNKKCLLWKLNRGMETEEGQEKAEALTFPRLKLSSWREEKATLPKRKAVEWRAAMHFKIKTC